MAENSAATFLSAAEQQWLKEKKEIVFISQTLYPPFEFIGADNNRKGMCIELASWIATEFGFKAVFQDASFAEAQAAVLDGRADVITSLFRSLGRKRDFAFTEVTWEVPALIFIRAERPDITALADLNGKTIAMQKGDYAAEFLQNHDLAFTLASTASFAEAVNLVIDQKADAVIGDKQIVLYQLYSNNLNQQIKSIGDPLYIGQNCMAVRNGERELLAVLNRGLALARKHGIFNRITQKWTGVHYTFQAGWLARHLYSVITIVCGLLLATLGVILWNLNLRRAVDQRTRELSRSEEKYRVLVESSHDLIWEMDKQLRFSYISPNVKTLLGYDPEELIGKTPYDLMEDTEAQRVRKEAGKILVRKQGFTNFVNTTLSKTGKRVLFETNNRPFFDVNGVLLGYRGSNRDITLKEEEKQRRRELEQRLQQAQSMETIGLMAGGVAHDLNNILSGIVSYPDFLLLQLPKKSNLHKPLIAIKESGERAAQVVADLLAVARGVAGAREIIDLNDLIDRFLASPELLKIKENHPAILIDKDLEVGLFTLSAAPGNLQKCLLNLILNAAEAINGPGRIQIRTRNHRPESSEAEAPADKAFVMLQVSDDGPGIGAEDGKHIFEPFYTRKKMGRSGTGLGLTVVWNTVREHGGEINVSSEPGRGATFTICLPATPELICAPPQEIDQARLMGRGESILVVDDEPRQREIAEKILTSLGYRVSSVASGEAAIDYLQTQKADLLLLDMIMSPGLNGRQTFAEIIKFRPEQKALIVSGFSNSEDVESALDAGAGKFIKKPYLLRQLAEAVKEILAG
ncbi:MAG: transporter substrate-binding domain-containing protein [Deltaproteobacteria bacterium]|nr:transporter substrate-binding domain-containing protein [Deltaproteobacteria bacterium]